MSRTAVLETAAELPLDEQFDLLCDLWDQMIGAGWQPKPSEVLQAELKRRLAAYEADPTNVPTHEQVFAKFRRVD